MSHYFVHNIRLWSVLRSGMVTDVLCAEENSMGQGVEELSLSQNSMSSFDSELGFFL